MKEREGRNCTLIKVFLLLCTIKDVFNLAIPILTIELPMLTTELPMLTIELPILTIELPI